MLFRQVNDACALAWLPELEPLLGAMSLLQGERTHQRCTRLFGEEQIAAWRQKYHFLFEVSAALGETGSSGILDFLLLFPLEGLTLEGFRDRILAMPEEAVADRLLGWSDWHESGIETIRSARTDDAALEELYRQMRDYCPGFLGFQSFLRQPRRYVEQYFSLAWELRGEKMDAALLEIRPLAEEELTRMEEELRGGIDPLEFSQERMGKTFRNRGPYQHFVFLLSLLLPYRGCRSFHVRGEEKTQILFLSLRRTARRQEDTLRQLRVMADPSRYRILTLLVDAGPLRGLDIARRLGLSPSTVSHHMDQLKECGLLNEEQVKNAKFFSVNTNAVRGLLAALAEDLKTK